MGQTEEADYIGPPKPLKTPTFFSAGGTRVRKAWAVIDSTDDNVCIVAVDEEQAKEIKGDYEKENKTRCFWIRETIVIT